MGELFVTKGSIQKYGTLGYIPQNAFLMNSSLKDNILFGREFDEDRYREVIEKC